MSPGEGIASPALPSRYVRGAPIGEGAMGVVVVAWDPLLCRHIAVKKATRDLEQSAQRLQKEAATVAQLTHPAIVPVFDSGMDADGLPWLAMRLVDGDTLAQLLQRRSPGEPTGPLLRTLLAVCQGMAHAHGRGVLHRDLKPANILVDAQGGAQIIDWGLACQLSDDPAGVAAPALLAPQHTLDGAVLGTPLYMSPEAARGQKLLPQSDVFCLGAMLYEVAAGQPLRKAATAAEAVRQAIEHQAPRWPQERDAELCAIVSCCLQADPQRRYPDAGALASDLANYLDGRRVSAHTYTPNQLLRRLAFAWRWQLLGAAAALLALAAVTWMAAQRVVSERDRAQQAEQAGQVALASARRSRADLQVRQAVVLAQRGAWPEAAVLAADALGTAGDAATVADARGVLVAAGAAGPTAVLSDDPLPNCQRRYVDPEGAQLLCLTAEGSSLWQIRPLRELWRSQHTADYGVVFGELGLVYLRQPGRLQALDLRTGVPMWHGLAASATVPIQRGVGRDVLQMSGDFAHVTAPGGAQHRWPLCPVGQPIVAADVQGQTALAVCGDGQLYACALAEPCTALGALPLAARDISALVGNDRGVWLASARGQVVRCEVGLRSCGPPVAAVSGMIRKLQVAGPWLMALADRGEVALLTSDALEPVMTTLWGAPSDAHLSSRRLTIAGERLRTYSLPETAQIAQWTSPAGTSLASFDVGAGLVATGGNDGRIAVRKASDGALLWSAAPANSVIKAVALQAGGEVVLASTATTPLIRKLSRRAMGELPVVNVRRLVGLRRGDDEWMVGATYGQGVYAWAAAAGAGPAPESAKPIGEATEDWLDLAAVADRSGAVGIQSPGTALWQLDFSAAAPATGLRRVRLAATGSWRNIAAASVNSGYAVADENHIAWFRGASSAAAARAVAPARVCDLAVAVDGRWVAAGLIDGSVAIYRASDLALTARTHLQRERVAELLTEPQGQALWAGSWDGTLRRLDLSQLLLSDDAALRGATARWKLQADQWSRTHGPNL
jgi:hypothetical protein